jgi:uncharacterized membrane protein (DUF106 family)
MYTLMYLISRLLDFMLYPLSALSPIWGIAFLAFLTALFVLWVYKAVSDQDSIRRLKREIQGYFLGIYIFRDDLEQIVRCQHKVFSNTFRYMGHALIPLAVIIAPVALLCIQMQLRYGHLPLEPGDKTVVSAVIDKNSSALMPYVKLLLPDGLYPQSPPLRLADKNEINWRIGVMKPGTYDVVIQAGATSSKAAVRASTGISRLYTRKAGRSIWHSIIYPGEAPIEKDSPISAINIGYPAGKIPFLGLRLHWSVVYFLLALVFGLATKRFLKVEF